MGQGREVTDCPPGAQGDGLKLLGGEYHSWAHKGVNNSGQGARA